AWRRRCSFSPFCRKRRFQVTGFADLRTARLRLQKNSERLPTRPHGGRVESSNAAGNGCRGLSSRPTPCRPNEYRSAHTRPSVSLAQIVFRRLAATVREGFSRPPAALSP